jgi:hypothetical protein
VEAIPALACLTNDNPGNFICRAVNNVSFGHDFSMRRQCWRPLTLPFFACLDSRRFAPKAVRSTTSPGCRCPAAARLVRKAEGEAIGSCHWVLLLRRESTKTQRLMTRRKFFAEITAVPLT